MLIRRLRADRGATAVEYGLIIGLVAIAVITALVLLGSNVSGLFQASGSEVSDAVAGGGPNDGEGDQSVKGPYNGVTPLASYAVDLGSDGEFPLPDIDGIQYAKGTTCTDDVRGGCGAGQITVSGRTLTTGSGWNNKAATQTITWTIPETETTQAASGSFTVRVT